MLQSRSVKWAGLALSTVIPGLLAQRAANEIGPFIQDYVYFETDTTNFEYLTGYYMRQDEYLVGDGISCGDYRENRYNGTFMYINYDDPDLGMFEAYNGPGEPHLLMIVDFTADNDQTEENCFAAGSDSSARAKTVCNALNSTGVDWQVCEDSDWVSPPTSTDLNIVRFCNLANDATCTTPEPTQNPSTAPSEFPTKIPTTLSPTMSPIPTVSPTLATVEPTKSPTTPRPTSLPTTNNPFRDSTPCASLFIDGLDQAFPEVQAAEEFNVLNSTYFRAAQRRMWSNGYLRVYFSFRWEDDGQWVISNGSYSVIRGRTLVDESNAPVDSAPGNNYLLWDHFSNDNVYQPLRQELTIITACMDSKYPTLPPTTSEPTDAPTGSPITSPPTMSPTPVCTEIEVTEQTKDQDPTYCANADSNKFQGFVALAEDELNGKPQWRGFDSNEELSLFWSHQFESWVFNTGDDGDDPLAAVLRDAISGERGEFIPPRLGNWMVFVTTNAFDPDCIIEITMRCAELNSPTPKPTTRSPTLLPTTGYPTEFPTANPSANPTEYPTMNPTEYPSANPTRSPVVLCAGVEISGTGYEEMDGLYERIADRNGRSAWNALYSDGEVFYSSFDKWTINSVDARAYFFLQPDPFEQPMREALWDEYLGTSPFLYDTKTIHFDCSDQYFPTPSPTDNPSEFPTINPTKFPTGAPTRAPTGAPSRAPTQAPSDSPTRAPTQAPSQAPSMTPTQAPTDAPIRSTVNILFVQSDGDPEVNGKYVIVDGTEDDDHARWNHEDSSSGKRIYYDESQGLWFLEHNDTRYFTAFDNWYPPAEDTWYVYSTPTMSPSPEPTTTPSSNPTGYPTSVTGSPTPNPSLSPTMNTDIPTMTPSGFPTMAPQEINRRRRRMMMMDRINVTITRLETFFPSRVPTVPPTMNPTMSPTTPCRGLQVSYDSDDLDDEHGFDFDGRYERMDYQKNNKFWWYNFEQRVRLKYVEGAWYFLSNDQDQQNSEGLFIEEDGVSEQDEFPPKGMNEWIYAFDGESRINVNLVCSDTAVPTPSPTELPTVRPTENEKVEFEDCYTKRFYTFVPVDDDVDMAPMYWEEPSLENEDAPWMHYNKPNVTQGDMFEIGVEHILVYNASDEFNNSDVCVITLFGVYTTQFDSRAYCIDAAAVPVFTVNQSYIEVDPQAIEAQDEGIEVEGRVYEPTLIEEYQWTCVAKITFVEQIGLASEDNDAATIQVLGNDNVGDILTLVILLWILVLSALFLYNWYHAKQREEEREDQEALQDIMPSERAEVGAGIAPQRMMRQATLTSMVTSPRTTIDASGGEGGGRQMTGQLDASGENGDEEKKEGTMIEMGAVTGAPSLPPPSLSEVEKSQDINSELYWKEETAMLVEAGFKNTSKNIELLVKYSVKNEDGSVNKPKTGVKVQNILIKVREKKKEKKRKESAAADLARKSEPPAPKPEKPPPQHIEVASQSAMSIASEDTTAVSGASSSSAAVIAPESNASPPPLMSESPPPELPPGGPPEIPHAAPPTDILGDDEEDVEEEEHVMAGIVTAGGGDPVLDMLEKEWAKSGDEGDSDTPDIPQMDDGMRAPANSIPPPPIPPPAGSTPAYGAAEEPMPDSTGLESNPSMLDI